MPFLADPFTVLTCPDARLAHAAPLRATLAALTVAPVTDDAEHGCPKRLVIGGDSNRPVDNTVPEHDPDGTPWAA